MSLRPTIAVFTTGGTIASTQVGGAASPTVSGHQLLAGLAFPSAEVQVTEVCQVDSSALSFAQLMSLRELINEANHDAAIAGIVVVHGTDTMEETAVFLDTLPSVCKPVIMTGAMFTADHPESDGPHNLSAAVADSLVAPAGVWIRFGENFVPAAGAFKVLGAAYKGFAVPDVLTEPYVVPKVHITQLDGVSVPIYCTYVGDQASVLETIVDGEPDGIVLCALGSGNANSFVAQAIEAYARDHPVVVTSRVSDGLVAPFYRIGSHLVDGGAIFSPVLRTPQARMLLHVLLAAGASRSEIAQAFRYPN